MAGRDVTDAEDRVRHRCDRLRQAAAAGWILDLSIELPAAMSVPVGTLERDAA